MEDLGVKGNLISVEPSEGLSGETKFRAKYSACSVQVFTKNVETRVNWKFTVEIGTDQVPFQSDLCSDWLDFVPPLNRTMD